MQSVRFDAPLALGAVTSVSRRRDASRPAAPQFGEAPAPARSRWRETLDHGLFLAKCWVQNTFLNPTAAFTPVKQAVFTVLDTETTGLDPKTCDLTEVTAIKYQGNREVARFSTLVKPSHPIPPKLVELTHITDDMVKDAPSPKRVLRDLATFVGPSPLLVGHNVRFDLDFITHHLAKTGQAGLGKRFTGDRGFCTKTLGQLVIPGLPSYKGTKLAEHLGIKNDMPHRAEYDVRMTAEILYKLIERANAQGQTIATVSDLRRTQGVPIFTHDGKPPILGQKKPGT